MKHTIFIKLSGKNYCIFSEFARCYEQCFGTKLVKFPEKISIMTEMAWNIVEPLLEFNFTNITVVHIMNN